MVQRSTKYSEIRAFQERLNRHKVVWVQQLKELHARNEAAADEEKLPEQVG